MRGTQFISSARCYIVVVQEPGTGTRSPGTRSPGPCLSGMALVQAIGVRAIPCRVAWHMSLCLAHLDLPGTHWTVLDNSCPGYADTQLEAHPGPGDNGRGAC